MVLGYGLLIPHNGRRTFIALVNCNETASAYGQNRGHGQWTIVMHMQMRKSMPLIPS